MAKGKIIIDQEKCKGCQLCVDECKFQEIAASKQISKFGSNLVDFLDNGDCTGCALCAIICPDAAIEVIKLIEE